MPNNSRGGVTGRRDGGSFYSQWLSSQMSSADFAPAMRATSFGGATAEPVSEADSLADMQGIPRPARRRSESPPPTPAYGGGVYDGGIHSYDDVESSGNVSGNIEANTEMSTVAQLLGHRASYPTIEKHPLIVGTHLAGVEIELEGIRGQRPRFNYWTAKGDGSLRNNGMEFVCSSPWGGRDLYNAAIEIDGWLFAAQPEDTWRCSTHVHVDVRDMTVPQVKRMILAYAMYERILFKCSGFHRYKNNFCVALGFAQEQINNLSNAWSRDDASFLQTLLGTWDKYSAMNLLPMGNFGSIEFRISEAKWRKGRLIRLVNRFLSLKEIAMQPFEGSEADFVEMLLNTQINKVIKKGLPKVLPDSEQDIEFGYKICHDILSMAKLRRLSIRQLVPNFEDGTRVYESDIYDPGWNHLLSRLNRLDAGFELPRQKPTRINFGWVFEIQEICRQYEITFDIDWFTASSLPSQHRQLYNQYVDEQRGRSSSRRTRMPEPVFLEEPEEDHEEPDGGW